LTADRPELSGLLHLVEDLRKALAGKDRWIRFLERRLAQRFEDTRQDYASRVQYFKSMQDRILRIFLELEAELSELTVGDLSIVTARKNSPERARQIIRTMRVPGFTVGDISVAADRKELLDKQINARHVENEDLTVGNLYEGPRSSDFAPSIRKSGSCGSL
jgi:hypothetical protein